MGYNSAVSDRNTRQIDNQFAKRAETNRSETFPANRRPVARKGTPKICARAALLAAFFCVACGYKPVTAQLPQGVNAIAVPVAENRTAYDDLSVPLTSTLRRTAARAGISVITKGARAAVLRVSVVSVQGEAGMLQKEGNHLLALDRIWRIEADASLEGRDGTVIIPQQRFTVSGRSLALSSSSSEEALAAERRATLLDDLAAAIVRDFFERR